MLSPKRNRVFSFGAHLICRFTLLLAGYSLVTGFWHSPTLPTRLNRDFTTQFPQYVRLKQANCLHAGTLRFLHRKFDLTHAAAVWSRGERALSISMVGYLDFGGCDRTYRSRDCTFPVKQSADRSENSHADYTNCSGGDYARRNRWTPFAFVGRVVLMLRRWFFSCVWWCVAVFAGLKHIFSETIQCTSVESEKIRRSPGIGEYSYRPSFHLQALQLLLAICRIENV